MDGYSLREVAARPRHASEFFGGVVTLRFGLGLLLAAGLAGVLAATASEEAARLVAVFAVGYLFSSIAGTLAAFLQANATVGRLAAANVAAKVAWGGLMFLALLLRLPLEALALILALSEGLRAALLYVECRKQLGLAFRVDAAATRAVLWAAVPYFATGVAVNLNRLDVAVLGLLAGKQEVGWYGAASTVTLLVLLLLPLLPSVVLPTLMRTQQRSAADHWRMVRAVTVGIAVTCVPLALVVGLGAATWVRLLFGAEFAYAAPSLRVLALQALFTYSASLTALVLIVEGRRWTVTLVSVIGVVATPVLGLLLIPPLARHLGPGGAGAGAALGVIGSEALVFALQGMAIGLHRFGTRALGIVARCLLLGAAAVGVDALLAPLGAWRLAGAGLFYVGVGLPLGVLPVTEVAGLVRELLRARGEPTSAA